MAVLDGPVASAASVALAVLGGPAVSVEQEASVVQGLANCQPGAGTTSATEIASTTATSTPATSTSTTITAIGAVAGAGGTITRLQQALRLVRSLA